MHESGRVHRFTPERLIIKNGLENIVMSERWIEQSVRIRRKETIYNIYGWPTT